MTIKRRLFISNILMIIIPVLLSLLVCMGMMSVVMHIFNLENDSRFRHGENFYTAVAQVQKLKHKAAQKYDLTQLQREIGEITQGYREKSDISWFIYQDFQLVYTQSDFDLTSLQANPFLETALTKGGSHNLVFDDLGMYTEKIGLYTVVVAGPIYLFKGDWNSVENRLYLVNVGVILVLSVVGIILLTNRLLTRFVFKSIITPLDTLVYGVHQIRDGNLDYRINYTGKDEFAAVCADFNEMAGHLLQMVNARQKDDENRRELIAGISHDLRTPLTSIKAYVEGIEKGVANTPELQARYWDTIKSKTDDLEHIVQQLFLFSKLDVGEFPLYLEKLDLGRELESYVQEIQEEYREKGLVISLEQNVESVVVKADRVQLHNALTNLAENSLKYGDKVPGTLTLKSWVAGQKVLVCLTDNGPGVAEEALSKLFNIFYRSDKARSNPSQGSGLGLAITAKVLERLGGRIYAENAPAGGLKVTIELQIESGGNGNAQNTDY